MVEMNSWKMKHMKRYLNFLSVLLFFVAVAILVPSLPVYASEGNNKVPVNVEYGWQDSAFNLYDVEISLVIDEPDYVREQTKQDYNNPISLQVEEYAVELEMSGLCTLGSYRLIVIHDERPQDVISFLVERAEAFAGMDGSVSLIESFPFLGTGSIMFYGEDLGVLYVQFLIPRVGGVYELSFSLDSYIPGIYSLAQYEEAVLAFITQAKQSFADSVHDRRSLEKTIFGLPESPTIMINFGLVDNFEMTLDWSVDRFSRDATIYYDNELAIAALALSGAAETTPGSEGEVRVSEMLEQLGFEKVNSHWYNYSYKEADTVACSFASKTIFVSGEYCNLIVVVNRGTVGSLFDNWSWLDFNWKNDWISNLGGASSFRNAANKVYRYLEVYIENAQIDTTFRTKLFITGHSRGGAVANILGTLVDDVARQEDVYVYTFASPKTTGTPGGYPNIINILNHEDLVPELSPFDVGRFGQDKWFQRDDESIRDGIDKYFSSITNGKNLETAMNGTLWLFDFPRSEFEKIGYAHDTATYLARLISSDLWQYDAPRRYIETILFD